MDFNITEYLKSTDMVLESILQLIFKKLSLVKFWNSIKVEYPQLSETTIKILFFYLQVAYSWIFSIYFNQKNIWQQIEYICDNPVVSY